MKVTKMFKTLIISCCFCFALILGLSFACINKIEKANAYISISQSDKVENLYNKETGKFDGNNLDIIAKKAGFKDIKDLLTSVSGGTNKVSTDFGTETTVNFGYYEYNGVIYELNWIPTYLSTDVSGNVILTLWLSSTATKNGTVSDQEISTFTDGTYRYNFTASDRKDYKGSGVDQKVYANTYDSSYIRNVILQGNPSAEHTKAWGYYYNGSAAKSIVGSRYIGGDPNSLELSKFTVLTSGELSNYLVTPQNVAWQLAETGMNDPAYSGVGNYSKDYYPTNWILDKIWLPSNLEAKNSGIWNLSGALRANPADSGGLTEIHAVATRTATSTYSSEIRCFNLGAGAETVYAVSSLYAVRPALHLNLSLAEQDCEYTVNSPTEAETTYTGNTLNISDFSNIENWYKGAYLDSTKIKSTIYLDGEEQSTIRDSGEYYIKFEFTDSYKQEVSAKDRPLKFLGSPNSTDSEHLEDDSTRWGKFIVKKKPLQVIFTKDSDNYIVASCNTADININDTGNRAPFFSVFYDSTDGKGLHFDETTEYDKPNKVGEYRATAKILNPECNYKIDTSKPYYTTYIKEKTIIVKPDISIKSRTYNATEQTFALMGGSGDYKDIKVVVATNTNDMVFNSSTGELKATKAGKYTIRIALADSNETIWNDNTSSEYTLEVEITKKVLGISFDIDTSTSKDEGDTNTDKWVWNADKTPTITITGDSYPQDQTRLYIYYYNSTDPSTKYADINNRKVLSEDGKTRTIIMPKLDPGNYVIGVEIRSSEDSNDNYEIARGVAAQLFTVQGTKVTLTNPVWKMNGNTITETSNLKYTYTGSPFVFTVDEDDLKAHGVEIDTSRGINGYSGNQTVTNASNSNYTVNIFLKSLPNYEDYSASFMLTYKIDKAKYDLSKLTWNYSSENNRTFKAGTPQTVTLVGTIPTGLTATYTGNDNRIAVNVDAPTGYITSVTFINADSTNYEDPIRTNTDSYIDDSNNPFQWFCEWRIEKAVLNASWDNGSSSSTGSTIVLPKLKPDGDLSLHLMVDYKYYETNAMYENPIQVSVGEIGLDKTKVQYYIIEATLKSSYSTNYVLSPETARCEFSVGSDKNVIQLFVSIYLNEKEAEERNLSGAGLHAIGKTYAYTGSPRQTDIELTLNPTGIDKKDILIKYILEGETEGSYEFPTKVGKYRAEISVKQELADSTIVSDDCDEFEFEIVKAKLDLSSVKLKYTHTYINPDTSLEETIIAYYNYEQCKWLDAESKEISNFTYNGYVHNVEIVGLDEISQEQKDKINISIQNSINGNLSLLGAGSQNIILNFSYDSDNFEDPNFENTNYNNIDKTINLPFNIAKAKVDASKIVWGYVENGGKEENQYTKALEYKRLSTVDNTGNINGYAVTNYTVKLINVPVELQGCIDYNNDCEHGVIGTYKAQFTLNSNFDSRNYEDVTWPSGLRQQFTWQILPKYIDRPVYNTFTAWTEFDNEIKDFTELFTLMEGWSLYYNITITKDGEEYLGLQDNIVNPMLPSTNTTISPENKFKALYAGKYVVKFTLKIENALNPNIVWKEFFTDVVIDVKPAEVYIDHWKNLGVDAEISTNSPIYDPYFFEYTFKDINGNIVTTAEIYSRPSEKFYKQISVKPEYQTCITLLGETEHEFEISQDGRTIINIPIVPTNLVYNGLEFNLETLLINFDSEIMYILSDSSSIKSAINAGVYKIIIALKDPTKYEWRTIDNISVQNADDSIIELTWEIKKASIKGSWQERDNYYVFIPFNQEDEDKFNLIYLDRYGAIVKPEEFKEGFNYFAELVLVDEQNYEFVNEDNTPFEDSNLSKEFIYSTIPQNSDNAIMDFIQKNLVYIIIGIVVLILFILLLILSRRRKDNKDYNRNYRNQYARQYDDFEDYDDRYYRRNRAGDRYVRRPNNYDDVEVEIMSPNHVREQEERLNNIERKLDAVLSQNNQNNFNQNSQNYNANYNSNAINYNSVNNANMQNNISGYNGQNMNPLLQNNFAGFNSQGMNQFPQNNYAPNTNGFNGANFNNYSNWLPQMDYNNINVNNAENYIKALINAYLNVKQNLNQDIARMQYLQGEMNNLGFNQLLSWQERIDSDYQNAKQNLSNINPDIKQKIDDFDKQILQKEQEIESLTAQRNSLQQNLSNQTIANNEVTKNNNGEINSKLQKGNSKKLSKAEQKSEIEQNEFTSKNLDNQIEDSISKNDLVNEKTQINKELNQNLNENKSSSKKKSN